MGSSNQETKLEPKPLTRNLIFIALLIINIEAKFGYPLPESTPRAQKSVTHLKSSSISMNDPHQNQDPSPISALNQSNLSSNLGGFANKLELMGTGPYTRPGSISTHINPSSQYNYKPHEFSKTYTPETLYQEKNGFKKKADDISPSEGYVNKEYNYEPRKLDNNEWAKKSAGATLRDQDQNLNEKDLVESILRRVLNSAGISPPKKSTMMASSEEEKNIMVTSNHGSAIKPTLIKNNEENTQNNPIITHKEPQKYNQGSFGSMYGANIGTKQVRSPSSSSLHGFLKITEQSGKTITSPMFGTSQFKNNEENTWKNKPEQRGSALSFREPKKVDMNTIRGRAFTPQKRDSYIGLSSARTQGKAPVSVFKRYFIKLYRRMGLI